MNSKRNWIILAGAVMLLTVAGIAASQVLAQKQTQAPSFQTAEVKTITAISSVETAGTIEAAQSAALFWQTTGQIATVSFHIGDAVEAGDILMTLDPATAPASVIMAQADLFTAQKALDELTQPTPVMVANAQNAAAEAQVALDKAERVLQSTQHPAGQGLTTAVADAKLTLNNAQADVQLGAVGPDAQAYLSAKLATAQALSAYQAAKGDYERYPGSGDLRNIVNQAKAAYEAALIQEQYLALRIGTDGVNQADAVAKAQIKYDQAVTNLNAAQQGPNQLRLTLAQSKVAVAEAVLADAQAKLDKLIKGADPKEVSAAQARVLAAQATLDSLAIIAPFGGEIIAVNYRPGDPASPTLAAVEIASRSDLHIVIQVNEADVSYLNVGDPVTITIKPLNDLELAGEIAQINPRSVKVQGLVKYPVLVALTEPDPKLLLGMTAHVSIVTDTQPDVLAVPLEAVQLDSQGEFVNRLKADGTLERVSVTSGQLQGEVVVVEGTLQAGDKVQIVNPAPAGAGASLLAPPPP